MVGGLGEGLRMGEGLILDESRLNNYVFLVDSIVSYFTNPTEHVVAVSISDNFSIIVLFNGSAHSIYEIKPAQTTV